MENEALRRLCNVFTVQDVMTSAAKLRRADDLENAQHLFNEYDVVPYPREGEIKGFFRRESIKIKQIDANILVSEGTSIFDLPALLTQNFFYFVISANRIAGYVHYSDLNKPITKIPYFAMFQAVERSLWDQIMPRISEGSLLKVFKQEEVKGFLRRKKEIKKKNVDIGWVGVFSFPRILRLARFYGLTHVTDDEIKILKETRNNLAHSDRNLITKYDDVKTLADAQEFSRSIIES